MEWIRLGSLVMALGVALGAFGAHGLKAALTAQSQELYRTAVLYQLIHGLGLLAVGWFTVLRPAAPMLRAAGWAFVIGVILFSGSLYLLSLTGIRRLGLITPLGGAAFLIGWFCLALATRS